VKRQTAYTRRLRQSRKSATIALLAMLFQTLFAMEHASAMAVASAKGGADGTPLGFLEICTASGLLRIPVPVGTGLDQQPAPRSSGGETCAICGTAAVSGSSDTPADISVVTHPHLLRVTIAAPASTVILSAGFKRSGTTRGPPVSCIFLT